MNALSLRLASVATALVIVITGHGPAQAVNIQAPASAETPTHVQYNPEVNGRWVPRYSREPDLNRWEPRRDYRRAYRDGNLNGYLGSRQRRQGYRYYNGYWFPPSAFTSGTIVGGPARPRLVEPRREVLPPSDYGNRHYTWCESRYRTYRASDNTYASSPGVRRACNSPYS